MAEIDTRLIVTEYPQFVQYSQYITEDKVWRTDAYLFIGKEKALLFDALAAECTLYDDVISRIGDKPLEVLVSHGHYDHAGKALGDFLKNGIPVYMNHEDAPALYAMYGSGYKLDIFRHIADGEIFDLGGVQLQVLQVAGHSPGSVVLLDRQRQMVFSGDALGAGEMQMTNGFESVTLVRTLRDLKRLHSLVYDMANLQIWSGHSNMAGDGMSHAYLNDLIWLVENVVSGNIEGERYFRPGEPLYTTRKLLKGNVCFLYNDLRIK